MQPEQLNQEEESKCPVPPEVRDAWLKSHGGKKPSEVHDTPHPTMLPTEREISTIPKVVTESDSGKEEKWIYPSQQMFFDAMKRKNWNPHPEDMKTIVPIHNAVNERAWQDILQWEQGWGSEK